MSENKCDRVASLIDSFSNVDSFNKSVVSSVAWEMFDGRSSPLKSQGVDVKVPPVVDHQSFLSESFLLFLCLSICIFGMFFCLLCSFTLCLSVCLSKCIQLFLLLYFCQCFRNLDLRNTIKSNSF